MLWSYLNPALTNGVPFVHI